MDNREAQETLQSIYAILQETGFSWISFSPNALLDEETIAIDSKEKLLDTIDSLSSVFVEQHWVAVEMLKMPEIASVAFKPDGESDGLLQAVHLELGSTDFERRSVIAQTMYRLLETLREQINAAD